MGKDKKDKKEKKKKGGKAGLIILVLVIIIAVAVAVLLKLSGGAGIGGGGSALPADATIPAPPETTASEGETKIVIEINESSIIADDVKYGNADALKEYLLKNSSTTAYILIDNHAVKSVYDEVEAILKELGCSYETAAG